LCAELVTALRVLCSPGRRRCVRVAEQIRVEQADQAIGARLVDGSVSRQLLLVSLDGALDRGAPIFLRRVPPPHGPLVTFGGSARGAGFR
jgi:hypothetical protein